MTAVVRRLQDHAERTAAIPQLAALRIAIFRDWPYLYDGTVAYETDYLREFAAEPGAILVVAEHDGAIVGAATASPMASQKCEFRDAVHAHGMDVDRLFYFGESVLLPTHRGQGIGHAFFDAREVAARNAGAVAATFCAVIRPADHPLRPADARELMPFWRARGYAPVPGLTCNFAWKDVDHGAETDHLMQFWSRAL